MPHAAPGDPSSTTPAAAHAPAAPPQPQPSDRIATVLLFAPVVATTIFAKFAVPPFGKLGLGLGFPLIFATLVIALFTGRLAIDARRAAYYAIMVSIMLAVEVAREEPRCSRWSS
jgi:Ca2+/H+ antiporter